MEKPQFLIGATSSGCGKTTFTLGLLRALYKRGLKVQPFKCGPDYLDTKHHTMAANCESYNLDTFMSSPQHVQSIYARQCTDADICITEGVMGLFDGYDNMKGSSAEIAELLDIPVILIVNARSTAYTVAAILYGFKYFRPSIKIAGVIFNFVSSPSHYAYLQQACLDAGVEALGYLPKCQEIEIPSRHLGLNIDHEFCFHDFADKIAAQIEKTVLIDKILGFTLKPISQTTNTSETVVNTPMHIAVARDEAFNFIYPANIRALEQYGTISWFSPIHDSELPTADFVYLPGGYPELYLPQLSDNQSMRQSILNYCQNNGLLLAECGGMMYLCNSIRNALGESFPMCGFLPQTATMENMKLKLGYRKVTIGDHTFHGHEFHYSHILPGGEGIPTIGEITNAINSPVDTLIYRKNRVTAGYTHFYCADSGHSLLDIAQAGDNNNY